MKRDYLRNREDAETLARRIRAYYRRSPRDIKVWVEEVVIVLSSGRKSRHFAVRSNIIMKVPTE